MAAVCLVTVVRFALDLFSPRDWRRFLIFYPKLSPVTLGSPRATASSSSSSIQKYVCLKIKDSHVMGLWVPKWLLVSYLSSSTPLHFSALFKSYSSARRTTDWNSNGLSKTQFLTQTNRRRSICSLHNSLHPTNRIHHTYPHSITHSNQPESPPSRRRVSSRTLFAASSPIN